MSRRGKWGVAALVVAASAFTFPAPARSGPTAPQSLIGGLPWRQIPTAPDSMRYGVSGTPVLPITTGPDARHLGYRVATLGRTMLRSSVIDASTGSIVRIFIRADAGSTISVRGEGGSWASSRVEWEAGPARRQALTTAWIEVRVPLAGQGVDFGRVVIRPIGQVGGLVVTEPEVIGGGEVCAATRLWTAEGAPLFYRDEPVSLHWARADERGDLRVEVRDARDSMVRGVTLPTGSGVKGLEGMVPGWYEASVSEAGCVVRTRFVIVPHTRQTRRDPALGLHVEMDSAGLEKGARLGAGSLRLHRGDITSWAVTEPKEGEFRFPDTAVRTAHANGFELLGLLDRSPVWASSDPTAKGYPWKSFYFGAAAAPPRDLRQWSAYAQRITGRYRGAIGAWEVWNEPDVHFLAPRRGTSHDVVWDSLVRSARAAAHVDCPDCLIAGPTLAYAITTDPVRWPDSVVHLRQRDFLGRVTARGTLDAVDIFTYHAYVRPGACKTTPFCDPSALDALVQAQHAAGRKVWRTEAGVDLGYLPAHCGGNDSLDIRLATALTTDFLATFEAGAERVFAFHGWYTDRPCDARALYFDGTEPRRSAAAYAALAEVLRGRKVFPAGTGRTALVAGQPLLTAFASGIDTVWVLAPSGRARALRWTGEGRVTSEWGTPSTGGLAYVPAGEVAYLWGSSSSFTTN